MPRVTSRSDTGRCRDRPAAVPKRYQLGVGGVDRPLAGVDCGQMGIAVLGPVTWDGSASLSPRDRVVLAVLATHPGHPVATDRIADALWGDSPPATAGKVVQGCVVRLRKVLGAETIETSTQGYALTMAPDDIDRCSSSAWWARSGTAHPGRARPRGVPAQRGAGALARRASRRWSGWQPARIEAARLGRAAARRRGAAGRRAPASRAAREVLAEAQALVPRGAVARAPLGAAGAGAVPGRAPGRGAAHPASGARRAGRRAGLDPGPELVALEQAILRQDPALVADGVGAASSSTAPTAVCCRTTSTTPTGSSAATPRSTPACAGWADAGAGRGGPVGLRQVVARARRGRRRAAGATAAASRS